MITSVIAVIEKGKFPQFTPILDATGVGLDRAMEICGKLKKICPDYGYTLVSGGTYDNCNIQAHVNDYSWE